MDELDILFDKLKRPSLEEMASLVNEYLFSLDGPPATSFQKRIDSWVNSYKPNGRYEYYDEPREELKKFYQDHGWCWQELRKVAYESYRQNF